MYGQRGAVFQAAGVQGPRATLQGVSIAGLESSEVSPMHLPNGTGIFPKLPNPPGTAYFKNLKLQAGYGHQGTQLGTTVPGHSDCSALGNVTSML